MSLQRPHFHHYEALPDDAYTVECNDRPGNATQSTPTKFQTYSQADRWLSEHEKSCPHAHTIYRLRTESQTPPMSLRTFGALVEDR